MRTAPGTVTLPGVVFLWDKDKKASGLLGGLNGLTIYTALNLAVFYHGMEDECFKNGKIG
jgi:hypothetical protein